MALGFGKAEEADAVTGLVEQTLKRAGPELDGGVPARSQFRTPPPPALNSDQYTADYNEVKQMGRATLSDRTGDQTANARFWALGTPADYWDPVAISLAETRHYLVHKMARLLAQVNLAQADAAIGCYDSKYTYSSWRPVSAVPLADSDGNDNTLSDPAWTPLIVTPPFPEHPSAHSCVSSAAARILASTFGEETTFEVKTNLLPGVTRTYSSFTAALQEVANARVFGGIHFRTATVDGVALGFSVGDFVLKHALQPERDDDDDHDDRGRH